MPPRPPKDVSSAPTLFTPTHNTNLFFKFADDTTIVGLINNNDRSNYRDEVSQLATWYRVNSLSMWRRQRRLLLTFGEPPPSTPH